MHRNGPAVIMTATAIIAGTYRRRAELADLDGGLIVALIGLVIIMDIAAIAIGGPAIVVMATECGIPPLPSRSVPSLAVPLTTKLRIIISQKRPGLSLRPFSIGPVRSYASRDSRRLADISAATSRNAVTNFLA